MASQITIQRISSNLPCIDRHTETLAGKARSLLQNLSGEFSRLPLDRILCHGAHDKARDLADRASVNRRSSEFFAGWPKILDGHTGPFWISSFVHWGFSDSQSVKILYFCSGPISVDPIRPRPREPRSELCGTPCPPVPAPPPRRRYVNKYIN